MNYHVENVDPNSLGRPVSLLTVSIFIWSSQRGGGGEGGGESLKLGRLTYSLQTLLLTIEIR